MRSTILPILLLLFLPLTALSQVTGVALLANETVHDGIQVRFTPTSVSGAADSTLTDSLGQFSLSLTPGVYLIDYEKPGFQPRSYDNGNQILLLGNEVLDTLEVQPGPFRLVSDSVSGVFDRDTIYVVTGDLLVPSGQALSLEAGTQVLFNGPYKITVEGVISALGNPNEPILFSHNNAIYPGIWTGIELFTDNNCVFEWCNFEYAQNSIQAIGNQGNSPGLEVRHSVFQDLQFDGIRLYGDHTAVIEDNQFSQYGGTAVLVLSSAGASSQIMCNEMSNAEGSGIYAFDILGDAIFANNYIHDLTGNHAFGIRSRKVGGDMVVQNNLIARVMDGIQETMNGTNLIPTKINNNVIYDCENGMVFTGTGGSEVRMNVVLSCTTGLLVYHPGFGLPADVSYNSFFDNGVDFDGVTIPGLGPVITTNSLGDSCDVWANLYGDPLIAIPNTWYPGPTSTLINAGDPTASNDNDGSTADIGLRWDQVNCFSIPELSTRLGGTVAVTAPRPQDVPLKMYPQPAHNEFRMDLDDKVLTLNLVGLDGRVYPLNITPDHRYQVDHLPRGLYIVRMETQRGPRTGRLLLQ